MDTIERILPGGLGLIESLILILLIAGTIAGTIVGITGLHIITSEGEHVGYITSVEKNGVIYKTWRVYVKTDTQSSQEDSYCVVDEKIIPELKALAESKSHVTVTYFDWFAKGVKNCSGEQGGIISAVKKIN